MAPLRIFIADDDPDLRSILTQLIGHLGHHVVGTAEDGEKVLALSAKSEFDLALTDLDMPVLDGLVVAEELSSKGIPVIIMSGHEDLQHVVRENEPVQIYLRKPFTLGALESAIESAIRAHQH